MNIKKCGTPTEGEHRGNLLLTPTLPCFSEWYSATIHVAHSSRVARLLSFEKSGILPPEDVHGGVSCWFNKRLLGENEEPPQKAGLSSIGSSTSVITTCALKRELRHTGLIGR